MRLLSRWSAPAAPAEWEMVRRLAAAIPVRRYRTWISRYDTLSEADRAAIRAHLAAMPRRPLISILIDATAAGAESGLLRRSLASLGAQLYVEWEACVAGAAADSADRRVRIVAAPEGGGEAAALNAALAAAQGEFVAVLDSGDCVAEHALYSIAAELESTTHAEIVYSDEDFCDARGHRCWPYFKPDWDPELAFGQDLLGRLAAMRTGSVRALGGWRAEFDPASQYDLHLRLAERAGADRIRHVPAVLYHRHLGPVPSPEFASIERAEAAREAVWCRAHAQDASVVAVEPVADFPFWNRLVRAKPDPEPLVSIVLPTRDRAKLLRKCVEGVLERTAYRAIELIVMDNDSVARSTIALLSELARDPRVRVLKSPGPFNFSAIANQGVAAARGEILLLLNNDVEVLEPDWLGEMVSQAVRPEIGAVGARLLFPDGRVQHSGIALVPEPNAYHALRLASGEDPGYFGQLALTRTYLAVTGACLAMRRKVFLEVGGLDERNLSITFNDVDLCLRVEARGYRVICTPWAQLIHRESVSRGADEHGAKKARARAERAYTAARWRTAFERDKYGNPNLVYTWDKGVALSPPRAVPPWRRAR